ncbi:MAG TPA: serine hydrolase domain-containing protein [bacterium]|nr:serine hydrolase domain-containing protein [bacterium]
MSAARRKSPVALERLLRDAEGKVFPAWQAVVSRGGAIVFEGSGGSSCVGTGAVDETSVFDLASLTKPLATVSLCMHFHDMGALPLDVAVSDLLRLPVAAGLAVTARRLLSHASGLPAWRALHLEVSDRGSADDRRRAILAAARETAPLHPAGTRALYSDLNFMLLTALLETLGGARLDALFARIVPAAGLFYRPLAAAEADRRTSSFVASEDDVVRGVLAGRVNDENAFAMGGVSGHAGLFGTATAVHALVHTLVEAWQGRPSWIRGEIVRAFWTKQTEPRGTTWALGWDTPSATGSSAGATPPADAVGHTGFTGGSIWVDPSREVIAVLLTNRTWPDRTNDAIRAFRPRFHQLAWSL